MSLRIDQLLSLTIFILFFGPYQAYACSCDFKPFCDYMSEQDSYNVVIKAKLLRIGPIDDEYHTAYLEIEKKFRDDVSVSHTIRLVGKKTLASCHIDIESSLEVGRFYYFAFSFNNPEGQGTYESPIPPSNNYWTNVLDQCSFSYLKIEDDIVKGWMTNQIIEYPHSDFERALYNCDFSTEVLNRFLCEEAEYYISPNPSNGRHIQIRSNNTWSTKILEIEIFNYQGIRVHHFVYPRQRMRFDLLESGVYFARISCPGRIETKKIIVEN